MVGIIIPTYLKGAWGPKGPSGGRSRAYPKEGAGRPARAPNSGLLLRSNPSFYGVTFYKSNPQIIFVKLKNYLYCGSSRFHNPGALKAPVFLVTCGN